MLDPTDPVWIEYDAAAKQTAQRGLPGAIGDPLPLNMTPKCVAEIAEHPEEFQQRVKDFAYARAMELMHEKYYRNAR